jgi:hypothetical protein
MQFRRSHLALSIAIAMPLGLVGCGGGGSSSSSEVPKVEVPGGGSTGGGQTGDVSSSGVTVFADSGDGRLCAALDAVVAVHDAQGVLQEKLSPGSDGSVALPELASDDQVTVLTERDTSVDALTVVANALPATGMQFRLTDYFGSLGNCEDEPVHPEFDVVVANPGAFTSVEIGPFNKFLSSEGDTPERATYMAEGSYRLFAGGYDAEAFDDIRRLTSYGMTDVITPTAGSEVFVTIDTAPTPRAVSLPASLAGMSTSWIDPDSWLTYDLEEYNFDDVDPSSITSINTIEPDTGYLTVTHHHTTGDYTLDQPRVVIRQGVENSAGFTLDTPDITALNNVAYSNGTVSYQVSGDAADSNLRRQVQMIVYGFPGMGETGVKSSYHSVLSNSVSGNHKIPDLSGLHDSSVADPSMTAVNLYVTDEPVLVTEFAFSSNTVLAVSEFPDIEEYEKPILAMGYTVYTNHAR